MTLSDLLFRVPVFGWMLKSAARGDDSEKIFFLVDLMLFWALAVAFFGLPALIYPAVLLAGGALVFLVFFTASDLRAPKG